MTSGFIVSLLSLWISFGSADALSMNEPQICYILDAVLFLYGIVLTILYCRLKIHNKQSANHPMGPGKDGGEGVYEGLTPHAQDTYETINTKKGKE